MRYEADACCPSEALCLMRTQHNLRQLLKYHCGCYGNLVTMAMRYVADTYHPKEPPYQIVDSLQHKTKELLTFHCGCFGNLVTIATKYVAGVYYPIKPPYQYGLKAT